MTKNEMLESAKAAMKNPKDAGKGAYTMGLILAGKLSVEEIAAKVSTTKAAVYWYRNTMRAAKVKLPEMERAAPAEKPAKKAVKKAATKKAIKKAAKKATKKTASKKVDPAHAGKVASDAASAVL